ncbi:hypothetical protein B0H16DRAFT_1331110 [Mycena metata]|uniref:Uncharacterized protein n=1 Tax=Mycena metata TaxID=1033252 RepID=A0AAD7HVR2_9AGAR|nr:hypothetical protein B0H16DRAFT_1331110 [Mycena metata]
MADIVFDDRPFVPADWIGKGKDWSSVPLEVLNAKHAAFTPPPAVTALIPDGNLPVTEFAAKYGTHHPVTDSTNISALSKISVQLFEKLHGAQFRSVSTATAMLQTKHFGHIPPINFLCLLSAAPKVGLAGLELASEDSERFRILSQGLDKLNAAMVLFRKKGKRQGGAVDDVDEEEGEV